MRILILHNRYREPGGEDSVVRTDVQLLRAAGHEVVLHEVSNPAGREATLAALAVSAWNPRSAQEVARILAESTFDVAHVHNTWFRLTPSVLKPLSQAGVPTVMTVHNYRLHCLAGTFHRDGRRCLDCLGKTPWRGVVHRCYRHSTAQSTVLATDELAHRVMRVWQRHVDIFIAPSEFTRRMAVAGGLPSDRVVVRPHYVPDPGPRPHPPSRSKQVVYAGRLSPDKGVSQLIQAWAAVDLGLELVLAGEGPLREEVDRRGCPSIRLTGWLTPSDLEHLMMRARAVVLPTSMFETFGLAAVEGMAAGVAVLTTEGGALAEAVGQAGPPAVSADGGSAEWSAALALLCDPAVVDQWGSQARQRYLDVYTPDAALARLVSVYELAMMQRR
jgi:glycosyltransferase involved in cell wall biosynthesis